jgi:hypothetical protein
MAAFPIRDDTMRRAPSTPLLTCRLRFHDDERRDASAASQREAADLSLAEARDLLDWLEGNGLHTLNVELTPAGRMTVRWVE